MTLNIFNTGYEAILSGVLAAFLAQVVKVFVHLIVRRKLNFKMLTTTGGMPSSHSAGVLALSTSIGLIDGFSSTAFAVALGFSIVIMYDAAGLRRAAGKTAATLNRLVKDIFEHSNEVKPYETLKELLGHTPFEVFCGALFGIVIALSIHLLLS
ncbi:divergent PAP2 family protein [bacterium]|nr:divergent PAP2 family protein [bacterium]